MSNQEESNYAEYLAEEVKNQAIVIKRLQEHIKDLERKHGNWMAASNQAHADEKEIIEIKQERIKELEERNDTLQKQLETDGDTIASLVRGH